MGLHSRIDVIWLRGHPENLEHGKRTLLSGLHRVDPVMGSGQSGSYPRLQDGGKHVPALGLSFLIYEMGGSVNPCPSCSLIKGECDHYFHTQTSWGDRLLPLRAESLLRDWHQSALGSLVGAGLGPLTSTCSRALQLGSPYKELSKGPHGSPPWPTQKPAPPPMTVTPAPDPDI